MLKKFTNNRYINLLSGLVLLVTSGYETLNTFSSFSVGAHHGILLFSVLQILKSLPDITDGLSELDVAVESK
jgi:hypothetical protein